VAARTEGSVKIDADDLMLRPAQLQDFAFCERTYFEPLRETVAMLSIEEVRSFTGFASRWQIEQVRIILQDFCCNRLIWRIFLARAFNSPVVGATL
jgi:hypothetical protein